MIARHDWMAIAIGATMLAAPAAGADPSSPLLGLWRTQQQDGLVQIYHCGVLLCGRIVGGAPLSADPDQRDINNKDLALRSRSIMHLPVLQNFTGGPDTWTGGPVYDPVTGDGAGKGTITFEGPNTLKVKGCIAMLLCRTQRWKRVS